MLRTQLIRSMRSAVRQCSNEAGFGAGERVPRQEKSVNKICLVGRLGRDIEIRQSTNGQSYAKLVVVTNNNWKTMDGEYKSNPEFHQVFQFASSANAERYFEAINDLFKSGDKVYVEGRLAYMQSEGRMEKSAYIKAGEIMHLAKSYKRLNEERMQQDMRDDELEN